MNKLRAIIVKEIKELIRDPKIILGVIFMPIIIFPLMGSAIKVSQESVQRAVLGASFSVYAEDTGYVTDALVEYLFTGNIVVPIEAISIEDALLQFQNSDSNALIHIPLGYSENITRGERGVVRIYANLRNLNLAETQSTDTVSSLIFQYNYRFSLARIRLLLNKTMIAGSPEAVRNPISTSYASLLKGHVLEVPPSSIIAIVMSQSILIPIMVMMMVMFAIQMATTSIALEKEQKTLEILMTLPVSRMTVLTGKLSGSIVIAIAGAVSYLVGFSFYMNEALNFIPETTSLSLDTVDLGITSFGFFLIGIVVFVTLVSALAMALSLAVFADNVRSAQSFTGILIIPIIIPAVILMFSDIEMLPNVVKYILLIIPYTHSIIATKAAFLGNYFVVIRSIVFISFWTISLLYIAAKIFNTERIITAQFTLGSLMKYFKR